MKFNAGEIASVIQKEIEDFRGQIETAEVGQVVEVGDGIARVYGLSSAMSGETNRLVALGNQMDPTYRGAAYDMLVASGEQVAIALVDLVVCPILDRVDLVILGIVLDHPGGEHSQVFRRRVVLGTRQARSIVERVSVGVVEVKRNVVAQALTHAELHCVVV